MPSILIISIKSNGFEELYIFSYPSCNDNRSATNSIYCVINFEFIPINLQGNALQINSFSISTASFIISCTFCLGYFLFILLYNKTANSVCNASSLEISSLLNVRPGINPRFFSQKIEQKAPEKNIPSMHANAINRVKNELRLSFIHRKAQSALFFIQGKLFIPENSFVFCSSLLISVSINRLYTSLWIFSIAI